MVDGTALLDPGEIESTWAALSACSDETMSDRLPSRSRNQLLASGLS